jgi:hypothetical protein
MIYPTYYVYNNIYPYLNGNPSTLIIFQNSLKTCMIQLKLQDKNLLSGYGLIDMNENGTTITIQFDYTSNGSVKLQLDGKKGYLYFYYSKNEMIEYELNYISPI